MRATCCTSCKLGCITPLHAGTFVYYFSYVINERYKGRPFVTVVSIANSFWVLGPLLGMYVAYDWIMSNSYAIVRNE